jgi:predicted Zn-dependent protease with MMP-like domain
MSVSRKEFEEYVAEALASIPPKFRRHMDNVTVSVEDEPTAEDLRLTDTPSEDTLFGIFRGLSKEDRIGTDGYLPSQVVVFRKPILEACSTRREIVEEIRETVLHEMGHLLGLDDDEMPF